MSFLMEFFFVKVQSICAIFSKSLSRHQRYQREAAAAALSEFICYRYVYDVNQHSLLVISFHYFTYFQLVKKCCYFHDMLLLSWELLQTLCPIVLPVSFVPYSCYFSIYICDYLYMYSFVCKLCIGCQSALSHWFLLFHLFLMCTNCCYFNDLLLSSWDLIIAKTLSIMTLLLCNLVNIMCKVWDIVIKPKYYLYNNNWSLPIIWTCSLSCLFLRPFFFWTIWDPCSSLQAFFNKCRI